MIINHLHQAHTFYIMCSEKCISPYNVQHVPLWTELHCVSPLHLYCQDICDYILFDHLHLNYPHLLDGQHRLP